MTFKHACYVMPFPPTVNRLFAGKAHRHRSKVYDAWIWEADFALMQQKPLEVFKERVDIVVHLNGGNNNSDCDNYNKAPIDRIVAHMIIEDDSKLFVRSVKAIWSNDVIGCMIEIREIGHE